MAVVVVGDAWAQGRTAFDAVLEGLQSPAGIDLALALAFHFASPSAAGTYASVQPEDLAFVAVSSPRYSCALLRFQQASSGIDSRMQPRIL